MWEIAAKESEITVSFHLSNDYKEVTRINKILKERYQSSEEFQNLQAFGEWIETNKTPWQARTQCRIGMGMKKTKAVLEEKWLYKTILEASTPIGLFKWNQLTLKPENSTTPIDKYFTFSKHLSQIEQNFLGCLNEIYV